MKTPAVFKRSAAASESGATLALIYGGDELAKGVVKIRNLSDRSEREVPRSEVLAAARAVVSGP